MTIVLAWRAKSAIRPLASQKAQRHDAHGADGQAVHHALHHAGGHGSATPQLRSLSRGGARDEERSGELTQPQGQDHEHHVPDRTGRIEALESDISERLEQQSPAHSPHEVHQEQNAEVA